ncbi:type 1 glutamine amidotransferase [Haloactinomyces albus]|uniref:GMP synthase-like glutamine amidotransferase n=1 Tax=Haloactinomyces albus TaxID=1352928 RepID=A0AAE3ZDR5_9ACTN|nr:type 1 glutamine amidotransferase [Haloactinomyces albus]MDR7303047.1 GMP synthase-like glutamine amidotransferase [Haloactinomyces albus]
MGGVRILLVQPSEQGPPQQLGEWLTAAGAELDVVLPAAQELPESVDAYSALVVLGGGMGALDDLEYPWLSGVRALLSQAVGRRMPVLGICLGAQLLAAATGGRVKPVRDGPEVGTLLVAKRDAAAEDLLLGPLPLTPDVLQFHRDEVASLPPSAKLLASSPKCENQVFRVGDWAYGLQFHIETSTDTVLEWARDMPDLAETARSGQFDRDHLDAFHGDLAETWQPVVERFVDLAGQSPDERPGSRSLPLV